MAINIDINDYVLCDNEIDNCRTCATLIWEGPAATYTQEQLEILKKVPLFAYNICALRAANYQTNRRWPEAEPYFINDLYNAMMYARTVLCGRWHIAAIEEAIMQSEYASEYINDPTIFEQFALEIKHNNDTALFKSIEQYILESPSSSYTYALTMNERYVPGEKCIKQSSKYAFYYATYVLHDVWPDAEEVIKEEASYAFSYATQFFKSRWDGADHHLMTMVEHVRYNADFPHSAAIDYLNHVRDAPDGFDEVLLELAGINQSAYLEYVTDWKYWLRPSTVEPRNAAEELAQKIYRGPFAMGYTNKEWKIVSKHPVFYTDLAIMYVSKETTKPSDLNDPDWVYLQHYDIHLPKCVLEHIPSAIRFACIVLQERWHKEIEEKILQSEYAVHYVAAIMWQVGKRWPEAEKIIVKYPQLKKAYEHKFGVYLGQIYRIL